MIPFRLLAVVLAAGTCAFHLHARAGEPIRYFELVNRAHDSVTALAVAPAGSPDFRALPLRTALRGGGDATTLELAADACRLDFRFTFRDGRSALYPGIDVCRHGGLRIRALSPSARGGASVAVQPVSTPARP